ncbi:MAG: succinate dehydrogenase cytochrome b subunit [Desulfatiglandales bacterium]
MNWFIIFITSSVGKKLVMAFTGLCFVLFIIVHLFGNLTIFLGKESFLSYVEDLHRSHKYLMPLAEVVLLIFGLLHIVFGLVLYIQNIKARPISYNLRKNAGGRTIGSGTMPYTGLFLLIFICLHLVRFRFVEKMVQNDFTILINTFNNLGYVIFYILAMVALGLHLSHGIWSSFQTFGVNHPKYNGLIERGGILLSILFAVGFASIPVYIFTKLS